MHLLLIILSLLSPWKSDLPPVNSEEIRWMDRHELTYSDFKGKVPGNTPWAALTSSYIYFTYGTTNGRLTSYKVYASFRKSESWMKIKNEEVLAHEQLHFDISEAFTRKLYAQVQELKNKSGDIPKQASDLFNRMNSECDQTQQLYDEETDHGVNEEEQLKWKKKVEELLSSYDPYPVPTN